jgi:ubiquinone/menaquinone biosynthesis C-methylase UbiE
MSNTLSLLDSVKHYYGQVLNSSADLKTSACCLSERMPDYLLPILHELHPEVRDRFYGCGSPFPPALEGATVLDLGCGSGRDCYLLSKLVGPKGRVIGVDMTDEQIAVADRHRAYHAERFGYANVEFRQGYIEDLLSCGIADGSVDLVISNCVLNLSPEKSRVFQEIFRVLKPGGELYFSDVFADRRIPQALTHDPLLLGECLSGAMYVEDFRRLMANVGCADARVVSRAPLDITQPEIAQRIGFVGFESITWRAFKIAMEDRCEDYGQVATYVGTVAHQPHAFVLDDHHRFETGKPMLVCGNTADMLQQGRYAGAFQVHGSKQHHFGLFNCAPTTANASAGAAPSCC